MLTNDGTQTAPIWMQQSYTNAFGDTAFAVHYDPNDSLDNESSKPTPEQQSSVNWALEGYKSVITDGGGQFEGLATALDGKITSERTIQERTLLDNILSSVMDEINLVEGNIASVAAQSGVAQKFEMPDILNAVNGDIKPDMTGTVLPWGIAGAYSQEKNAILLSQDTPQEFLKDVAAEELGEAIAAYAEDNGVVLQDGDVGNRMANVLTGKAIDGGRESGKVLIDGKIEVANFSAESDADLAAEWGVEEGLVRWTRSAVGTIEGGPVWTAESYPDIPNWGRVVEAYGTNGELSEIQLVEAIITGGGDVVMKEVEGAATQTFYISSVNMAAQPSEYAELATQWGHSEQNVGGALNIAEKILDRKEVNYLFEDDAGYEQWGLFLGIYGNGTKIGVNGLARAIADGVISTNGDSGFYVMDGFEINNISPHALTDALWRHAEEDFGSERSQITIDMFDEATDRIMNDTQAFTGDDYDAFIEHFADTKANPTAPVNRFSREAILAMFTTGALVLNDSTGKDHISFSSTISEHHQHPWYESSLGEHAISGINQLIGMISHATGYAADEVAYIFGKAEDWTEEMAVTASTMIGDFVHHAISDSFAAQFVGQIVTASITDNPDIDADTFVYVEDLVNRFRTEGDPMAGIILLRALTMPKENVAEFLNQSMASDALLNATVSEEVGGMIVDGLQASLEGLWEGDEPPDPSALQGAGALAMQQTLTSSLSATNLDENAFAQYLGDRDGDARFDFAAEAVFNMQGLASALGTTEGVMDKFQTRFIFTHPRRIEGDRYHSEFRIRFFDEVGLSVETGADASVSASGSVGMQNYHDIVIPVTFDSDWSNVEVEDVLFKATFNGIAEADVGFSDKIVTAVEDMKWLPGDTAEEAAAAAATWTSDHAQWVAAGGQVLGKAAAMAYKNADIEVGAGVGASMTFNLEEMTASEIAIAAVLMIAPTVAGGFVGAADGGGVYGAHWGADIGNLVGTGLAYAYEMAENPEAVGLSFEAFGWVAGRPNRANLVDDNVALRNRYQHNEGLSANYSAADNDWDFTDLG